MKKFKKAILLGLSLLIFIPFFGSPSILADGPGKLTIEKGGNVNAILAKFIKEKNDLPDVLVLNEKGLKNMEFYLSMIHFRNKVMFYKIDENFYEISKGLSSDTKLNEFENKVMKKGTLKSKSEIVSYLKENMNQVDCLIYERVAAAFIIDGAKLKDCLSELNK